MPSIKIFKFTCAQLTIVPISTSVPVEDDTGVTIVPVSTVSVEDDTDVTIVPQSTSVPVEDDTGLTAEPTVFCRQQPLYVD